MIYKSMNKKVLVSQIANMGCVCSKNKCKILPIGIYEVGDTSPTSHKYFQSLQTKVLSNLKLDIN